jgi:hypothetical protein
MNSGTVQVLVINNHSRVFKTKVGGQVMYALFAKEIFHDDCVSENVVVYQDDLLKPNFVDVLHTDEVINKWVWEEMVEPDYTMEQRVSKKLYESWQYMYQSTVEFLGEKKHKDTDWENEHAFEDIANAVKILLFRNMDIKETDAANQITYNALLDCKSFDEYILEMRAEGVL